MVDRSLARFESIGAVAVFMSLFSPFVLVRLEPLRQRGHCCNLREHWHMVANNGGIQRQRSLNSKLLLGRDRDDDFLQLLLLPVRTSALRLPVVTASACRRQYEESQSRHRSNNVSPDSHQAMSRRRKWKKSSEFMSISLAFCPVPSSEFIESKSFYCAQCRS